MKKPPKVPKVAVPENQVLQYSVSPKRKKIEVVPMGTVSRRDRNVSQSLQFQTTKASPFEQKLLAPNRDYLSYFAPPSNLKAMLAKQRKASSPKRRLNYSVELPEIGRHKKCANGDLCSKCQTAFIKDFLKHKNNI